MFAYCRCLAQLCPQRDHNYSLKIYAVEIFTKGILIMKTALKEDD